MITEEKTLIENTINSETMAMLIIAKGPSAKKVEHLGNNQIRIGDNIYNKPSRLEIASVNCAWKIIDSIDYAFIYDYSGIQVFKDPEIKNLAKKHIKRIILPTYPHLANQDQSKIKITSGVWPGHIDINFKQEEFQSLISNIPYYLTQTDASLVDHYGIESFSDRVHLTSTAYIAVQFGIARGFRHFILNGFDVDLNSEESFYSSHFDVTYDSEQSNSVMMKYQFAYLRMIKKIIEAGCTYQTLK